MLNRTSQLTESNESNKKILSVSESLEFACNHKKELSETSSCSLILDNDDLTGSIVTNSKITKKELHKKSKIRKNKQKIHSLKSKKSVDNQINTNKSDQRVLAKNRNKNIFIVLKKSKRIQKKERSLRVVDKKKWENTLNEFNYDQNSKDFFKEVSLGDLIDMVNQYFKTNSNSGSSFLYSESFTRQFREHFDDCQNDIHKEQNFRFMSLKIILCQFLSVEKLKHEMLRKLTPFEHLVFFTLLKRLGYVNNIQEYQDIKKKEDSFYFAELRQKCLCRRSEQEMLTQALELCIKKLTHPFKAANKNKKFYSNITSVALSEDESEDFFAHYFGDSPEYSSNPASFKVLTQKLDSSEKVQKAIKIIKKSSKILDDIHQFVFPSAAQSKKKIPSSLSNLGIEAIRRQKYQIAFSINILVNNFSIALNQFDPVLERKRIVEWMSIIIRDLAMNPRIVIPWNLLELNESVSLLKSLLFGNELIFN